MPKTAILSSDDTYYSTRRIKAALESLGIEASVLDPAAEFLPPEGPPLFDLAVPRLGARFFGRSIALLDLLVRRGCRSLQDPQAIRRCRKKSSVLLGPLPEGVVPVPSALAVTGAQAVRAAELLGGFPVVVKPDVGTQGGGAAIIRDEPSLRAYAELLASEGEEALVQPYLEGARDVRAFVAGGRVAAAMSRTPAPGDFRANVHRGAAAAALDPAGPWAAPAISAALHAGLAVAGVDFLEHRGRIFLLEVNASPGLKGIEAATGARIAEEIARLCAIALANGKTDPLQ